VSAAMIATLENLNLQYPKVDKTRLQELQSARKSLESE